MTPDARDLARCLTRLKTIVPFQYGQWLVEDPESHDYQVVASIIPEGEEGYDVAHRTGVIGQVFRSEKTILVPDTRNHRLYDPFDNTIDWELAFPVFVDEGMKGVINLEGAGSVDIGDEVWRRVCKAVQQTTKCRAHSRAPLADSWWLVNTRRVVIRADQDADHRSDIVELARAIARGGVSTLLVGHFPDLLRGRGPTLAEANQQSLGVSYCYFGVERRLDLLATGPLTQRSLFENEMDWWESCSGRYAFVLSEC
jgi:hypothetical protein